MTYEHPIIVIHWDDAVDRGDGGHKPQHKPSRQVCVGWLLAEDETGVTLAFEYSDEDHSWRNETFIPAAMIDHVDLLEVEE